MARSKRDFLLVEITKETLKIKESYPVIYKTLGETPLFGKSKGDIKVNNELLENYLETLKALYTK